MDGNLADYKTFVDISKGYLDTVLQAHIWFYAITGAVVSYYLSKKPQDSYISYSLVLPFFLGIALVYTCWKGWSQASALEIQTKEIGEKLKIADFPPIDILKQSLFCFGILDVLIVFGLGLIFFSGQNFLKK